MPVRTGIFWNFQKDMTIWDTLLRSEQKVIMELDNLNNSVFTGAYNVTIKALYYNDHVAITPADQIYPISAQLSSKNQSSVLSLPDQNATAHLYIPYEYGESCSQYPRIWKWCRGVLVQACSYGIYQYLQQHPAIPYSPFREVQLLIDGQLAGVSWPFPIIFTGGISPGLWVPIVGIDTYDVPSFEIDVTPFLPLLCDGDLHTLN
jgi:hypothetical protein